MAQLPADRKSQTGTAVFSLSGTVGLLEGFENQSQFITRDPNAAVLYFKQHKTSTALRVRFNPQTDVAGTGKFKSVGKQVFQNLPESHFIGFNFRRHLRIRFEIKL